MPKGILFSRARLCLIFSGRAALCPLWCRDLQTVISYLGPVNLEISIQRKYSFWKPSLTDKMYNRLVALSLTGDANIKAYVTSISFHVTSISMLTYNSSNTNLLPYHAPFYTCVRLCALVQQTDGNWMLFWWILLNCCFILTIWSSSLLWVQGHTASVPLLNIIIPDAWWHVTASHSLISDSKPNSNKTGTWFGLWPLNSEHYCLPPCCLHILLILSVSRFTKPTAHVCKAGNLGETAASRRRCRLGLSPPHRPLDFPPVKKNKFQTTGSQERRCWAICVSIKQLSGPGCLEMAEMAKKLFHSIKVDVITGSFLSALSTGTGSHTTCKWLPPDPASCSCR